jgi:SAM-dependent methyltransferase
VRFPAPAEGTEGGVDADAFRPSADAYGRATADIVRCLACGHGSVAAPPDVDAAAGAYAHAIDEVSLREEAGQVATARRDLERIEEVVVPGRVLDVGCWTGSFLVAAAERGWQPVGIEPSRWAADRARQRGVPVVEGELSDFREDPASFRLVSLCDVLEHLADPGGALDAVRELLEPGGVLFVTVPDAGSRAARLLGRRWWSVLPMHLQYFTRQSLERLLGEHGFAVETARTHSKIFTVRYYAERFGGYSQRAGRLAVRAVEGVRIADRLVAVDLRDRLAVIARRSS